MVLSGIIMYEECKCKECICIETEFVNGNSPPFICKKCKMGLHEIFSE